MQTERNVAKWRDRACIKNYNADIANIEKSLTFIFCLLASIFCRPFTIGLATAKNLRSSSPYSMMKILYILVPKPFFFCNGQLSNTCLPTGKAMWEWLHSANACLWMQRFFLIFLVTCHSSTLEGNPLPLIRFFLGTIFKEHLVDIIKPKQEIPRTGEHGISNKKS